MGHTFPTASADQTTSADGVIFAFGAFTLDPRTGRLLKGGTVVPLTTKAFDTLEALLRSAGRTVTKDQLLRQVWPGTFVQDDTLAQNISTIRKALGDTAESPRYLLTVPREGYRFVAQVDIIHPPAAGTIEAGGQPTNALLRPRRPAWRRHWLFYYVAGAASGVLLAATAFILWKAPRVPSHTVMSVPLTFEVFEPTGTRFSTSGGTLAVSPDGRHLAFLASDAEGRDHLWIRAVDSVESRPLPGTLDASQPFWSADSQSIAFFAAGSLRRIDISGGESRPVCPLPGPVPLAGSWNQDGLILFGVLHRGIFEVNASGGTPMPVALSGAGPCSDCLWPSFLPDGHRFLFTVISATSERGIYVGSLGGAAPRRLVDAPSSSAYASGYLFYASAGALVARRFDPVHDWVSADRVPVADRVWYNTGTRRAVFSVSDSGLVAYRQPQITRLQWISRSGAVLSRGPEGIFHTFAISRDARVLAAELDTQLGTYDLWRYDAEWGARARVTLDPDSDVTPLWSADAERAVFAREMQTGWQLYQVNVDSPGAEQPLLHELSRERVEPVSWNDDALVYAAFSTEFPRFWALRPGHADRPRLISEGNPSDVQLRVSPDRKWLAYTSSVPYSRVPEAALFVRPWLRPPAPAEITAAGAVPRWSADGRELFFIAPGGRLMAQQMEDGHAIGPPVHLCTTEALASSGVAGQAYDATPDGQRFLIKIPARRPSIIVMSGWRAPAQLLNTERPAP